VRLAAQGQSCVENRAGFCRSPVLVAILFIDQLERIAGLDVALEVYVIAHSADHPGHDRQRHARLTAGIVKAGTDNPGMTLDRNS
jgi:hypothetical protein